MKQIIGTLKAISKGQYSLEEYCKLVLKEKNITTSEPYTSFADKFFNDSEEIFGTKMLNVNGEIYQVVAQDDYSNKEYISFAPASDPGYFIYYTNVDNESNINDIIKEGILNMFSRLQNYLKNGQDPLLDEWLKKYPQSSNEAMKKLNEILNQSNEFNNYED